MVAEGQRKQGGRGRHNQAAHAPGGWPRRHDPPDHRPGGAVMKPNDENGKLPTSERPFRVLLLSGSDRRQYNCPGVDPKSRTLMLRLADRLPPGWEVDLEDLGNVYGRPRSRVATPACRPRWRCAAG